MTTVTLNDRELATVLAALRLMENEYDAEYVRNMDHFLPDVGNRIEPLTPSEIDALCEAINR